jgi:phosphoenolpyruvate synthase/pyruvate phosphate dikinase
MDYTRAINRKEWEFEFAQRDVHPALMTDFWLRAIRENMPKELKLPVKVPDYLFTSTYKGFIKSADKKDILEKIRVAVGDRSYQDYIFTRTIGVVEEFNKVVDEVMTGFNEGLSKEELIKRWNLMEPKFIEMIPWYWIPWYLTEENVLADRVKNRLENYKEKIEEVVDYNTAVGVLLFPTKEAHFQREQKDLYKLVKSEPSDEDLNNYLSNYGWMKTYFLLPKELLTKEELLNKINEAKAGTFVEEFELQQKKKEEFAKLNENLQAIFSEDSELIQSINDSRELAWILQTSVENGIHASSKLIPFLKLVAKNISVSYEHLVHLRSDEILEALKGIKTISQSDINERLIGNAAFMVKGDINWLWGKEANEFTKWIDEGVGTIDKEAKEFKGQPAFKGKVTGKVRIALNPAQSKELVDGEILVTSMTSPDYVPAMRKAAAIVTDEGGLLSHAAIMSREFGKPCVVGTKIATTLLKTGDMIEVDATTGIIKRII